MKREEDGTRWVHVVGSARFAYDHVTYDVAPLLKYYQVSNPLRDSIGSVSGGLH